MTAGQRYARSDAKDWGRANLRGACDVILPSFTADLRQLNEAGIRHDVRRNIELGYWGALLVSEAGTTLDEMRRFMEIAVDEAKGEHYFLLHGAFDTADDIIAMTKIAESIGIDGMLLGHPNSFYPKTTGQLRDYLNYIVDAVDLGVVLFAAHHFNFDRLDPAGYPLDVIVDVAKADNVMAVKYEVGRPGVIGTYECFKAFKDSKVIVSDPFEANAPIWTENFEMPWMGTSNYEYFGDVPPRMLAALLDGRREEALDLYWQIQPARSSRLAEQATFGGANFIHRYLWKYQAWLTGFNGGPMRQPIMKLADPQMRRLADALVRAKVIDAAPKDFSEFFVGRNPA